MEPTSSSRWADDWLVRTWRTKDGLPQNTVNAMVQTRDGYIWVGTSGGLARFDGVQFRTFGLQDGLRSVRISTLLEDQKGTLWVGTTGGGLRRWENGRFNALAAAGELGGADILATAVEPGGTVWIGTDRGLLQWRDGHLRRIEPAKGLPSRQVRALLFDSKGNLWVSVGPGGLFMGTQGGFAAVPREPSGPASVYCLLEDREGSIWAGSDVGVVWQWQAGLWRSYGETNGLPKSNIEALAQGSDDTIWAGTRSAGVYFFREGGFHPLAARTGSLSAQEAARRLLADREDGTLWVGTADAGMSRLSRGMLSHWGTAEGLKHPSVTAVAEGSSGDWWVGTQEGGLYQLQDRRLSKCLEPAVLARFPYIYSVLATEEGGVWAAGENCLFRFRKGQPTQAYLEAPIRGEAIRALCADGTNLWMGTYYSTLLKCEGTNIHMVATNGSFGGDIRSIVREASDTLWIGSASGLYRWERGQVKTWNTGDGLLTASVQSLFRDSDGTMWIGTLGGGLARLKEGRIVNMTTRQGLIDDIIHQIVPDDLGHLWLGCNHGLMRLERQDLNDCADGRAAFVHPMVLGQDEGLLSEQCAGGHSPTAIKTKSGRILSPTTRGLAEIDPRRWEEAVTQPPQASIDEVLVDDQIQRQASNVVVNPGSHRLRVNYTAPSLRGTDLVRFRHRLEPADEDWVNTGHPTDGVLRQSTSRPLCLSRHGVQQQWNVERPCGVGCDPGAAPFLADPLVSGAGGGGGGSGGVRGLSAAHRPFGTAPEGTGSGHTADHSVPGERAEARGVRTPRWPEPEPSAAVGRVGDVWPAPARDAEPDQRPAAGIRQADQRPILGSASHFPRAAPGQNDAVRLGGGAQRFLP